MKNFENWKKDSSKNFLIGIIGCPITLFLFFFIGYENLFWLIFFALITVVLLVILVTNLPPYTNINYKKWKDSQKKNINEKRTI